MLTSYMLEHIPPKCQYLPMKEKNKQIYQMLKIPLLHSIIYPVQHKKVNDFLQTPSYTVAET